MENVPVCGRFAPSPSGRMHLGNLWSCLLAWLSARSAGGRMVLRLEDLDPDRCRREYCDQVMRDLEWLGLDWDNEPVYQSQRSELYRAAFQRLADAGLVYPCYCTRAERLAASAPHASDGARVYNGHCRTLSAQEKTALLESGRRPAWRLKVPAEVISFVDGNFGPQQQKLETECGDFILRRSDGVYAYQLAVTADDGAMGITRVVRGWDLLSSTPRQIWLLEQLGYPIPTYCHLPLLVSPDGRRLSKRDRDLDMGVLRQKTTPEAVTGFLAHTAGLLAKPEPVHPRDLIPLFSWDKVGTQDRIVDSAALLTHR